MWQYLGTPSLTGDSTTPLWLPMIPLRQPSAPNCNTNASRWSSHRRTAKKGGTQATMKIQRYQDPSLPPTISISWSTMLTELCHGDTFTTWRAYWERCWLAPCQEGRPLPEDHSDTGKLRHLVVGEIVCCLWSYTGNKNLPYFIKYVNLGTINIRK